MNTANETPYKLVRLADRSEDRSIKYHGPNMKNDEKMIPLWVADMDFEVPQGVTDALTERVAMGVYGYTMPWKEYADSVLGWMKRRHQTDLEANWLVAAPGIVPAIKILIRALTRKNDEILIFQPVYYPFKASIELLGRTPVECSLAEKDGHYSIDFKKLEEILDDHHIRMMIFCSPHNPTGNVWSREDLKKIADLCLKHDIILISDEIHMDFDPDHRHTTMLAAKPEVQDHLILATAPSKTFNLAGLQASNLFIPNKEMRKKVEETMSECGMGEPNILGLVACQAAYDTGDEWVDELNSIIRSNTRFVKEWLEENLPEIRAEIPEGTYLMWLDCRNLGLNDEELSRFFLDEAHLWLNPGIQFGEGGSGYMRLNAACSRETLEKALSQLKEAAENRKSA